MRDRVEQKDLRLDLETSTRRYFCSELFQEGKLSFDGFFLRSNEDLQLGQKFLHVNISAHLSTSLLSSEEENDVSKIIRTKVCKFALPLYFREFAIEPPTNFIDGIGEAFVIDNFNLF